MFAFQLCFGIELGSNAMDTGRGYSSGCVAFGILAVLEMMGRQLNAVDCYPLSLDVSGLGIHQRQPSYLPDYNGIFSLQALNFTPAAIDKTEKFFQVLKEDNALVANISFAALLSTTTLGGRQSEFTDHTTDRLNPEYTDVTDYFNEVESGNTKLDTDSGFTKLDSDYENTKAEYDNTQVDLNVGNGELDSGNLKDTKLGDNPQEDLTTFPQIHVVTKTITSQTFQPSSATSQHATSTVEIETTHTEGVETTTIPIPSIAEVLRLDQSNNNSSEALLTDSDDDGTVKAGEKPDIFDHLMKTIQSHWTDFVGKMKLSVLDVWKSISEHMMDRLETFASAL